MADRKWKIGKTQVILYSGSKLLKVLVIVLIVLSTAALGALWWVQTDLTRQTEAMRAEAAAIEYANSDLEAKIAAVGTLDGTLEYAKDELGMVSPDTVLIQPQS